MQLASASSLSDKEMDTLLRRPRVDLPSIFNTVAPIVDAVRERGDEAVNEFTAKFDNVELGRAPVVLVDDLPDPQLDATTKAAFDTAYDNIRKFHEAQITAPLHVETMPGVVCERVNRPIDAVGLYVP